MKQLLSVVIAMLVPWQSGATTLIRQDLSDYPLAKCNDGSPAAYYYQSDIRNTGDRVMIYLPDGGDCATDNECDERCSDRGGREVCSSPKRQALERSDAIWSDDPAINPFARHFKVYLHYCSSDNYAGTRGASRSTGNRYFHGKHIVNALLEDLTLRFDLDRSASLTLVGTGSGAKGVGYNCDHVASLLPSVPVRCVADSPDIVPWWVRSEDCRNRDLEEAEREKIFWGREDDDSCVQENKGQVNSSELAHKCGVWSRYWTHINTPFFLVGSQFDTDSFERNPCTPDLDGPELLEYELAWRRGTMALYESMLAARSDFGWFVPDCKSSSYLAGEPATGLLQRLTLQEIDTNKTMSLTESLTEWIENNRTAHAIDSLVSGNLRCGDPAPLCRSSRRGCHLGYDAYPSVRRGFLPPSSLFPRGYNRRCCLDPGYSGTNYLGYDGLDPVLRREYSSRGLPALGAERGRRNRLWKRVLLLQYLKQLYKKHKIDYAREYYGLDGGYDRGTSLGDTGLGTGFNGRIPPLGFGDSLGDYYDYDTYGDYSGILSRIRNAVRLKKKNRDENGEKDSSSDADAGDDDFDFEDFGPIVEEFDSRQL